MAGRAKENLPGGSLKYLFVYLNVVTVYNYIYIYHMHLKLRYKPTERRWGTKP